MAGQEGTHSPHVIDRIKQNVLWLFQSSVVVRLLGFAQNVILARLLAQRDFGIFGLASSLIGFTLLFGDVGIGPSLLYPKDITEDYKSTAFWLNCSMASTLLVIVVAVSPLIARIYYQPKLTPVLIVLASAFWFQVLAVVHHNLLKRELRFRALAIIEIVSGCISLALAFALALGGWGVWAFVVPLLANNVVNGVLMWRVSGWTPIRRISKQMAREVGAFSGWYMGATIAFYLAFSLDRLLIGKFLGIESVGRYSFAYDLALASMAVMSIPLMQVVVPEFASLRFEPERFWDAYIRISGYAATVMAPVCCAGILAAPGFIPLIFGSKWASSVLPFQILVVYMLLRAVIGDACGSRGRYDLTFRLGLGALVAGGFAIFVGLHFGIVGVALGICIVGSATQLAGVYLTGSLPAVNQVIRKAGPPVLVAACTAVAAYSIGLFLSPILGLNSSVRALGESALYLGGYAFFQRRRLSGLLGMALRQPSRIPLPKESYPEC